MGEMLSAGLGQDGTLSFTPGDKVEWEMPDPQESKSRSLTPRAEQGASRCGSDEPRGQKLETAANLSPKPHPT